ncbi:MAG: hypothetical protein WCP03_03380 [Candidatus Saccharibacteria bacterium]
MSQDEYTKLFVYMQNEFKNIGKRFDRVDKRFDVAQSQMDGLIKLITDYNQEMLMLSHKVDRLEKWINQIATKAGVHLEY